MSSDSSKLLSKEEVLLDSLHEFYKNKNNIEKILPIVTGNSEISLRVLDYFVTNYSKYNDVKVWAVEYGPEVFSLRKKTVKV